MPHTGADASEDSSNGLGHRNAVDVLDHLWINDEDAPTVDSLAEAHSFGVGRVRTRDVARARIFSGVTALSAETKAKFATSPTLAVAVGRTLPASAPPPVKVRTGALRHFLPGATTFTETTLSASAPVPIMASSVGSTLPGSLPPVAVTTGAGQIIALRSQRH